MQEKDRQGNSLYNYEKAYDVLEKSLIDKYYGNPD